MRPFYGHLVAAEGEPKQGDLVLAACGKRVVVKSGDLPWFYCAACVNVLTREHRRLCNEVNDRKRS